MVKEMSKISIKTLLVALSLAVSTAALSQITQGQNNNCQHTPCVRAPEINPAEALGALALLGGAVAIIRGYRRRQK
jgi:hypothetical protein